VVVGLFALSTGCGPGAHGFGADGTNDSGSGPAMPGGDSGVVTFVDAGAPPPADDDCPAEAKLVYLAGNLDELWSFYPPTLTFTKVGRLSCPSPWHMTVDRKGVAWLVSNGQLYNASTKDATCTPVPTWKSTTTLYDFALTFVGTATEPNALLYLVDDSGALSSFDPGSGTVAKVGTPFSSVITGDMTSNGDGTIYYSDQTPPHPLHEIAPSDGAMLSTATTGISASGTQALAFWGGIFYVFVSRDLYGYDPKTKTTQLVATNATTFAVTGAGQSTCVPQTAPPPK
jgi:hypothetical protein